MSLEDIGLAAWLNLQVALLCISLLFYYWGSGKFILFFLGSIVFNYYIGLFLSNNYKVLSYKKQLLIFGIILNLCLLGYFKYYEFFYNQIAEILKQFDYILGYNEKIFLPIGISFYTFMAISYLVETYRGDTRASNIIDFGMYMTLYPHLVAGPIVRYSEIAYEIKHRKVSFDNIWYGVYRFSLGLAKKVLIANNLGQISDNIFLLNPTELSTGVAWIGILCYTLQIYFDFSGYSDMAIGLARIFGFHFPENFNLPYTSKSITEFWRKWHMSLSRWFRDFVYIPLGGNRVNQMHMLANLFIVFLLCGLWHGASWTFVIWGCYHGFLLILERVLKNFYGFEFNGIFGHLLTIFLIMIGWVLFRSISFDYAMNYISVLLHIKTGDSFQYFSVWYYLRPDIIFYIIVGITFSFCKIDLLKAKIENNTFALSIITIFFLIISMISLSKSTFTPFIYFQF